MAMTPELYSWCVVPPLRKECNCQCQSSTFLRSPHPFGLNRDGIQLGRSYSLPKPVLVVMRRSMWNPSEKNRASQRIPLWECWESESTNQQELLGDARDQQEQTWYWGKDRPWLLSALDSSRLWNPGERNIDVTFENDMFFAFISATSSENVGDKSCFKAKFICLTWSLI